MILTFLFVVFLGNDRHRRTPGVARHGQHAAADDSSSAGAIRSRRSNLNFIAGIEPNLYIAIPLFILAGELLNRGGVGVRIIRFVRTMLGWLPEGSASCVHRRR